MSRADVPRGASATLRAALIAPGWPPSLSQNGVTSYVARLRPALLELGVDVPLISASLLPGVGDTIPRDPAVTYADDAPQPRAAYVKNRLLGLLNRREADAQHLAARFVRTLRLLHRERPVHVYEMEEAFGHARRLVGRAPGKQVVRLHGPWFLIAPALGVPEHEHWQRIRAEGESIAAADLVTSPSHFALDAVRERYALALSNARVIPNATPIVEDPHRWSRATVEPGAILFVGRADRLKGADTVIEAFARVHAQRPEASLWFVGPDRGMPDGAGGLRSLEAHLEDALEPAARAKVRVFGSQTPAQIEALRPRAEVTVVASRFETFGMTVIEAMAAGAPLVASRAGAIPELLDWAEEDLLFEPGDAEALAARLLALFADPSKADALAARGRDICAARYSPARVAQLTLDAYASVR